MKKIFFLLFLIAGSFVANSYAKDVAVVRDDFYKAECASCHFAYQAGLLPSRSWEKLMGDLSHHFGTDASLEREEIQKILKYLTDNSAEKFTQYKRSKKINDSIAANETPLGVTKTGYFIKKHEKIARRHITQKEVKSLANCMACHTAADKGSYSEREIVIPNFGKYKNE